MRRGTSEEIVISEMLAVHFVDKSEPCSDYRVPIGRQDGSNQCN
jgi:hypothetical protein